MNESFKIPEPRTDEYMLWQMVLARRFEERVLQCYQQQKFGGFCHVYIGQEAVVVGARAATRDDDNCITAYRDHAHGLVWGISPRACMAELYGKATGCSRGLGGSMHYFDKEKHLYGGHGIVGGHLPLATGLAFAAKYRNEDTVTLCFFGDGALNIGSAHEAMNLASIWKLRVIFLCENNLYGMGTHIRRSTSVKEIVDRAKGYDMKSMHLDGHDARKMRDGLTLAIDDMRKNPQPYFVEALTYRYRGHSVSDPGLYRTKEEVADQQQHHDPLTILKTALLREGRITESWYEEADDLATTESEDAALFAEQSPDPSVEDLYKYVFINEEGRGE